MRHHLTPVRNAVLVAVLAISGCTNRPERLTTLTSAPGAAEADLTKAPATVAEDEAAQGCAYAWARRDLPQLSDRLQRSVQANDGDLRISAYAFGEECQRAAGVEFLPMETDFRVVAHVDSIADETGMGHAILAAMMAIETLDPADLVGPRTGRVEFEFTGQDEESVRLNLDIDRYRREGRALRGADLFRHFFDAQP